MNIGGEGSMKFELTFERVMAIMSPIITVAGVIIYVSTMRNDINNVQVDLKGLHTYLDERRPIVDGMSQSNKIQDERINNQAQIQSALRSDLTQVQAEIRGTLAMISQQVTDIRIKLASEFPRDAGARP